jgi:hypothetical protein
MRIQLSDAIHADDLARFLARSGCIVERVADDELEASMLGSFRHDRLRLELDLLLRAWESTRTAASARILD